MTTYNSKLPLLLAPTLVINLLYTFYNAVFAFPHLITPLSYMYTQVYI